MRTNNPMRGLLSFFYYSSRGNASILLLLCVALAIAALITNHHMINNVFSGVAIGGLPYVIVIGMAQKNYSKWEQFQLTMPVRRCQLIGSQYLCIFLASLVGIPLVVLVKILSFSLHDIEYNLVTALLNHLLVLSMPLVMTGVLYPLASTKFGSNKGEIFFAIGLAAAIGYTWAMSWIGARLDWSVELTSVVALGAALVIFLGSYFITKDIYEKTDF